MVTNETDLDALVVSANNALWLSLVAVNVDHVSSKVQHDDVLSLCAELVKEEANGGEMG